MSRRTSINMQPLPSCSLPAWVTCELDALLASGLVHPDALDGMDAAALCKLAASSFRSGRRGFDANRVARALAEGRED